MMQSFKRKAEQEARRIKVQEEQARKREEERKRVEEAERKRDEERIKKQKILDEHRQQKSGGVWESEGSLRQKSKWNMPARQSSPARSASNSYCRSNSQDNHSSPYTNGDNEEELSRYFTALEVDPGLESSPESILLPKDHKQQLQQRQQNHQKTPLQSNNHSKPRDYDHTPVHQQQVPTTPSGAGDDSAHRPSTPGVGFVIVADVVDHSPVSELTMAKKKELIMQQSIKRRGRAGGSQDQAARRTGPEEGGRAEANGRSGAKEGRGEDEEAENPGRVSHEKGR